MNKQELIEELIYELENVSSKSINKDFEDGYNGGIRHALELVKEKKLDEPKKVIFSHEEKFVADWLDGLKGRISDKKLSSGAAFMVFVGQQLECLYYNEYTLITDDVEGWLLHPENKVKLLNAIDNGYEVEKEPRYYVKVQESYIVYIVSNNEIHIKKCKQELATAFTDKKAAEAVAVLFNGKMEAE